MTLQWFESLRSRLILLVCLSAAPPLGVAIYNAFYEQKRIESDALNTTYNLVKLASKYQSGLIKGTEELLNALSHAPVIVNSDWQKCDRFLAGVTKTNSRYSNVGVITLDGNIACSGIETQQKVNVRDRKYFREVVRTQKFSVGEYHVGRVTGIPSIGMAAPVFNSNGEFFAVVYGAIKLDTLTETIDEVPLPPNAVLMVFDRNGTPMVKTNTDKETDWVDPLAKRLISSQDGHDGVTAKSYQREDSTPWIVSWAGIDGIADKNALSIFVATPMNAILEVSRKHYLISLGLMFLASLAVFGLAIFGTQAFILKRIETLIRATKMIGNGRFSLKVKPLVGNGELGELANHIDDMSTKIERFIAREQEYRYLFERNPNPMWIFSRFGFQFVAVNDAAVKHYGFTRKEFLGMKIGDVLTPDELERAGAFITGIEDHALESSIWRHITKSGQEIIVQVATYPINFQGISSIMCSIKDITNESIAKEEIAARDEQIRSMLESTTEAICGLDMDGLCTFANPALVKLLGYGSVSEVIGKNMHALTHHSTLGGKPIPFEECEILKYVLKGQKHESDKEVFWRKDGSCFPVEYRSHPIYKNGALSGALVTFTDISDRKSHQQHLEYLASHDSLTSLPNRRNIHDHIAHLLNEPDKKPFAVALLDLDRFKEVNDTLGHQAGDILLIQLANRINSWANDIHFIARLGGDEFAVVLDEIQDPHEAKVMIEHLIREIEQPFEISGIRVQVGVSAGISLFPEHGSESSTLMRCADIAMYSAKSTASVISFYDLKADQHSAERLALMSDIHQAIEDDQLLLHFQPKVDLKEHKIVGFEALIRWDHPQKGLVPPDEFIPFVEVTSLIRPFTYWVIDNALAECKAWKAKGLEASVAVNVSTRNLLDLELPKQIEELLQKHELVPTMLELEITESAIMADPVRSVDVLNSINELGVTLSIDDFGTGYSSLGYLQKLPIDTIKIDQSFIRELLDNDDNNSIVSSVIQLAHSLNVNVVAEGVEDEPTLKKLKSIRCDVAQGYFISRPLPKDKLYEWLESSEWLKSWDPDNQQTRN